MTGESSLKNSIFTCFIFLMVSVEHLFAQQEVKGLYIIQYEQMQNKSLNKIPIDIEKNPYFVLFPVTDSCLFKKNKVELGYLQKYQEEIVILNDYYSCNFIGEYTDLEEARLVDVKDTIAARLKYSQCIQKNKKWCYKCLYIEGMTQTLHENECKKGSWKMILNDYTISPNSQQGITFLTKITKCISIKSYEILKKLIDGNVDVYGY